MTSKVSIAVHGSAGRMGQALLRQAAEREDVRVVAALVKPDSPLLAKPLSEVVGGDKYDVGFTYALGSASPDVLIDFSAADAFDDALAIAVSRRIAFVSGTTGLAQEQRSALARAAQTIPVLWSANFSIGVAVLTRLAREAAIELADWDCEIVEAHHRNKKDVPSGTALALGREIAAARDHNIDRVGRLAQAGINDVRDTATIGFAAVRGGDIVGEHTIIFAGDGERIELVHRATNRDIFARGALTAAVWIAKQAPSLYSVGDMFAR